MCIQTDETQRQMRAVATHCTHKPGTPNQVQQLGIRQVDSMRHVNAVNGLSVENMATLSGGQLSQSSGSTCPTLVQLST